MLCQNWIENCRAKHKDCYPQTGADYRLPTRLLDLGISKDIVRLCIGRDLPDHTSYMTLSHCWGKSGLDGEFKMLTNSTLGSLINGISIQLLSRTFQEAISISRSLGSRYLWIDALCIIQEDTEDWARESTSMTTVYGFSQLNIAASAASKGSEGCFQTRDPALIRTVKVNIVVDTSKLRSMIALCSPNWRRLTSQIQSSPLAQRAWAFQETYLAARTLYFTGTQIWWGCAQHMCCEMFPQGLLRKGWRPTILKSRDEEYGRVNHWYSIVDLFSKGCLTFESDKLVSLSGVARHYSQLYNMIEEDYLAGLWRPYLVDEICWVPEGCYRSSRQHSIPTWSWASVIPMAGYRNKLNNGNMGGITRRHLKQPQQFCAKVLEAGVERVHDPYGAVQGGFIRLKCETLIQWPLGDMMMDQPNPDSFVSAHPLGYCYMEENLSDTQGPLFLLRIKMSLSKLEGSDQVRGSQYCCLVVEAVLGGTGVYRRIGIAQMHDGYLDYLEGKEEALGINSEDRLWYYSMRGPSKFGDLQDKSWFMLASSTPTLCIDGTSYEESLGPNEVGTLEYILKLI